MGADTVCLGSKEFSAKRDAEILNAPLYIGDRIREIKRIDFLILCFTVENLVESEENIKVVNWKKKQNNGITRGLHYIDVD